MSAAWSLGTCCAAIGIPGPRSRWGRLLPDAPRADPGVRLSRTGLLSQVERDRHSGYGVPMQLRSVGSLLQWHAVPALSPEHALQLTLPLTGRRPSTVSAADVTRHCSRHHRYNAAVRLLIRVHAHRSAVAFMGRSGVLAGHGWDLPGSVQRTSPRAWGLRQREAPRPQAICAGRMLPSLQRYEIGTSELDPFRCSIPSPWSPLWTLRVEPHG